MQERTCPTCGSTFTPATEKQRYCPPTPEQRAKTKGQPRSRCAKRAYNHAQRTREGRVTIAADAPFVTAFDCTHCGASCVPGKDGVAPHASRFCSQACKIVWHTRRTVRRTRAKQTLTRAAQGRQGRTQWIEGPCVECGQRFTRGQNKMAVGYCSRRCKLRATRRTRRARMAGVGYKSLTFQAVALRDGWTCHLCAKPVDATLRVPHRMAPTMDHVIPLSMGGTHTLDNVALAHFICNSRKGDGTSATRVGGQLQLV